MPRPTLAPPTRRPTSLPAQSRYSRATGTTWTQQAYIKASNTGQNDWFGVRLALSGDGNTLAAGAQNEDSAAQGINGNQKDESGEEAGAVYLFARTGAMWRQQAYIKGSNTQAYDEFGGSVALSRDGRTLAVGARGEDSGATGVNGNQADNSVDEAGAVYVFATDNAGASPTCSAASFVVRRCVSCCSRRASCRRRHRNPTLLQDLGPAAPVAPETVTRDDRGRATVRAVRITQPLRLDGRLDDEVYDAGPTDRRVHPAAAGRGNTGDRTDRNLGLL